MRIALIGDLQYATAEEERLADKFKAIRDLSPDYAVMMGDFGGSHSKSDEGYLETKYHMDLLGCDYSMIFGNHDVEYRAGEPVTFDPAAKLKEIFGKEPFTSTVIGGVLLICVSAERQPAEGMITINSVYLSDERFEWIKDELRRHPGMPTILFTHAPAAGCGIRRWLPLHCAAMDGYLDQAFNAARWQELPREFPQIRLWCSAHIHMGHDYDSAITEAFGTLHVSCGAMTVCARDDLRQTRIIDVGDDMRAVISTFEHSAGTLRTDAATYLTGDPRTSGRFERAVRGEILLGNDLPEKVYVHPEAGRKYVATENGLLWEYSDGLGDFTGALSLEGRFCGLFATDDRLYLETTDNEIFSVGIDDRERFDSIGSFTPQNRRAEKTVSGRPLDVGTYSVRGSEEGLYIKIE